MHTFPDASLDSVLRNTTRSKLTHRKEHRACASDMKKSSSRRGRIQAPKRRRAYACIIWCTCTFSGTEITSRSGRGRPPVFFALFVSRTSTRALFLFLRLLLYAAGLSFLAIRLDVSWKTGSAPSCCCCYLVICQRQLCPSLVLSDFFAAVCV